MTGKSGFGSNPRPSKQPSVSQLPDQPRIAQQKPTNYKVKDKDLIYVNSFQNLVDKCLVRPDNPSKQTEIDPEIVEVSKKSSHLYREKTPDEVPFSDMQNKLDLFQVIDKVVGGGDLHW